MIRPPPRSTRTDTLFPYTTLFRSKNGLTQGGFSAWRDLPTDEQIAVHIQDIALNLFVSDVPKEDAVNNSIHAASSTNGSIDPNVVDGMQALRTGLGLIKASHLTIVRFQHALSKSHHPPPYRKTP